MPRKPPYRPYGSWSSLRGQGGTRKWLLAHVDYDGDDCLIWPFARIQSGRGHFGYEGKHYQAHVYMCELVNGPCPPGHEAAHSCGRGHDACVHPKHLSWKTRAENRRIRLLMDGARGLPAAQIPRSRKRPWPIYGRHIQKCALLTCRAAMAFQKATSVKFSSSRHGRPATTLTIAGRNMLGNEFS